jgi:catechol 2,3-dioxygenase-like lactoylglutathione lyase family enzyme
MTEKPRVNLRFLYNQCNDVKTIKEFYADCLGMKLAAFEDKPEWGWANFASDGIDFMFFRADTKLDVPTEFAFQPGDGGGPRAAASWSVQVQEPDFRATVDKLRKVKVKAMTKAPTWRQSSYWGFTVLDPMGNTVEVYCVVKDKPASTEWKD